MLCKKLYFFMTTGPNLTGSSLTESDSILIIHLSSCIILVCKIIVNARNDDALPLMHEELCIISFIKWV